MYLTLFYFCITINFIISILIFYILIQFYRNYFNLYYSVKIVKAILPHTSTTFFLPIFFCFTSSFDCTENNTNLYSDNLKCYTLIYYINNLFSIISIGLFVSINLLALMIFYEYALAGNSKRISKTTSKPDVFFAICKISITLIFVFLDGSLKIHYILIFSCIFFSFILMMLNFSYPRFNNNILIFINQFLSLSFFWACFVLLIGRFTLNNKFDSCLGIYFITEPIFCLILIFYKKDHQFNIMKTIGKEKSFYEMINQIKCFINLLENKDIKRNAYILLKGYIEIYEETCPIPECPLKKYQNCVKYGNNGYPFLLQHAELLFSLCLSKFPNQLEVKFAYALFLIQKMKKRKQAGELLKGIEELNPSIEEQFIIYRCNRIIEDDYFDLNIDENNNVDFVNELEFKNLKNQFLSLITNASNLYIEFWSQLFASHSSGSEDLTKLNECGTQINIVIEEINEIFEKIQKIRNNDFEILKIYSDFLNDILNDKEKSLSYRKIVEEIGETADIPHEINFNYINPYSLSTNDKFQYIIVSANNDSFGMIKNVSLSISTIFGFEYGELIGKSLDIIMPDIYQKEHRKILKYSLNEYKKQEIENLNANNKNIKEIITFGRNKSKYLIELHLKILIIQTENNELFFVGSILKDLAFFHTNHNLEENKYSYILTNKKLEIQNFTANAVFDLGLSSSIISNNIEITIFIKQLQEEFLQIAIKYNNQLNSEQKLNIKRNILSKKYKNPVNINWKRTELFESKYFSVKLNNSLNLKNSKGIIGNLDDGFILVVNEVNINNKLIGYIFKFDKLNINNIASSKIPSTNTIINNKNKNPTSRIENITPKRKNYSDIYYPNNQNDFKVDPNFIPTSTFNFKLNTENLTYSPNESISSDSLRDEMKDFVMKELAEQNKKLEKENEENEEENEEENDEEDSESSSYEDSNNINKNNNQNNTKIENIINYNNDDSPGKKKIEKTKSNILSKDKTEDEFYKVNFSKIKFLKYDYSKNILIEVKDWEKISKIETKMKEGKKIKEEEKENKEINEVDNSSLNNNPNLNLIIGNEINQENNLSKEIEYALKKKDSQESISLLNTMSIFVFILIMLIGGTNLYYIIHTSDEIKNIGFLIMNTYRLLIFNSVGAYYIRELTLLNNENYTQIPSRFPRNIYIETTFNKTMDLFKEMHQLLTFTTGVSLKISKKNYKILFEDQIETQNIQKDYSIKITKTTMQSGFIESCTALYNILTKDISEIIPTEQDTFFFLKNSLNVLSNAYYTQGDIYFEELHRIIDKIELIYIIGFVIIFLILIGIYFIIRYAYDKVSKKKESYIEVFFEIGPSVIKSSLDKCENFAKKLKNEEEEFEDSYFYYDEDYNEKSFNKPNEIIKEVHNTISNINDRRKRNSQLSKIFKIKFGIFLFLILIFFTVNFALFYLYLEKIIISENYFKYELIIEDAFYIIFNCLREYLFDQNSTVRLVDSKTLLLSDLEDIYILRKKTHSYMNEHRKELPNSFYEKYSLLNAKSPCDYISDEYFENKEECLNYLNGATRFGYFLMNSYFIEEIRFSKDFSLIVIDISKPMNNLTLTGTEYGKSFWPTDSEELKAYVKNDPINCFNYESTQVLNIVMNSLYISYFITLKQVTIDAITKYLTDDYYQFIIMLSIYLSVIFVLFLLIWVPFVKNLNSIIYKTKNMLRIIPKEVLASVSNIDKLLNIDKSSAKTNKNSNN